MSDYIRVRFNQHGKTYVYRCPGCKKGDLVEVPASSPYWMTSRVRVIGHRRMLNSFFRTIKDAKKVLG